MRIIRRAIIASAIGGLVAGAGVALAVQASAEPPSGNYTITITDNGGASLREGAKTSWILSPCGPDCTHVHQADDPQWDVDLHLQGNAFVGAQNEHRIISIDKDSLVTTETLTMNSGQVYTVTSQLAKA